MGSRRIIGEFYATDWQNGIGCQFKKDEKTNKLLFDYINNKGGITAIQEVERYIYGDDYYNGSLCLCSFSYAGDWRDKTDKEIKRIIEKRMIDMPKCSGEVAKVETVGVIICSTDIEEVDNVPFNSETCLKSISKGASALVEYLGASRFNIKMEGPVTYLQGYVNALMRGENYSKKYYIVTKSKMYFCSFKAKFQYTTTRKSNDTILVLPVHKYIYFGRSPIE